MTRQFNQQIHCPNCNTWITHETSFGRWIRNNAELDSQKGYCVTDQDYWIHQFKTFRGKDFQLIMMVEIKTMGAPLSMAQKDTLHMINQITRNRKQTPTKDLQYQAGVCPVSKVYSLASGKKVYLRVYGVHVLTFSGLGPDDSEWMKWDLSEIDKAELTQILRFDLDPDTLNAIDLRYHHKRKIDEQPTLFSIPE
uniref:Uncharacterized protein n=1 Tax=viral metagenome TaxID=1070528 RepID=A0A6M3LMQ3_9ZZZZ